MLGGGLTAATRLWPVRRHLRRPDQFTVFGGRLEQHHVHRRRSEGSETQHSALAGLRNHAGDRVVPAGQCCLSRHSAVREDSRLRDRVASDTANVIFPGRGAVIMAVAIMISTFGCNNGLILAGARAYYAMARDGLFFKKSGRVKSPARSGVGSGDSGNLGGGPGFAAHDQRRCAGTRYWVRKSLRRPLDYVISAALIFYILTIAGIFRLAPNTARCRAPVQGVRLPDDSDALHHRCGGDSDRAVRLSNRRQTWPGLIIVITGIPVYFIWRKFGMPMPEQGSISRSSRRGQGEYEYQTVCRQAHVSGCRFDTPGFDKPGVCPLTAEVS